MVLACPLSGNVNHSRPVVSGSSRKAVNGSESPPLLKICMGRVTSDADCASHVTVTRPGCSSSFGTSGARVSVTGIETDCAREVTIISARYGVLEAGRPELSTETVRIPGTGAPFGSGCGATTSHRGGVGNVAIET